MERIKGLKAYLLRSRQKDIIFLSLRWLALLVVLILSLFNPFTVGVLLPMSTVFPVVVIYNLVMQALGRIFVWPRRPLNRLALDTLVTTVAIYLTGGSHSSFFIVFYFVVVAAAFYLNLVQTIVVTLLLHALYITICLLNPASRQFPYTIYSVAVKSALLPLVAILCALFLEQLRRERQETEQERALVSRLTILHELFQQLGISLDLEHVLQTVVTASCDLLEADVAFLSLVEDGGRHLRSAAVHGMDDAFLADMRWPMNDELVATMLETGQPYVMTQFVSLPEQYRPFQTALEHEGFVCGASTPLLLNGQPVGFLDVGHRQPHHYRAEDLTFLSALGQEAAIAVRNARLYQAERQQVEQLQALERLQTSFVSSVSHELRTPLTILRTSLALLREQGEACPSEMRQELLETSEHHAGRLEALVTDLLEVTRLEAGQMTLSRQPTDLRTIVKRTVQAFVPLMQERQQTITLDMPPRLSQVSVDRRRIEQVLNNLLSNALKFTPRGGHIQVDVQEQEQTVEVSVQDDGPGVPLQERERIFEKFYTLGTSRGLAGVGLGLYIARQLVNLHGGDIRVESQSGAGSRFYFRIPK
ncbi:MAG: GAF domain-containing protein [Chloroflexi bacterium]|nr:GAF domain-containing protein [Chloroflexota bacterium]